MPRRLRILLLNWRDIRSPRAGGAEVLTHEVAAYLAGRGDAVTWLTSRPDELPREETIDGVNIIRRGSELTTRAWAPFLAQTSHWDLVIEEINTLPWLTPLWSRRRLLFIPQLAREVWWYEAPAGLASLGFAAEPAYLSLYRRTETVTISRSTVQDLRQLGFTAPIHTIPMAATVQPVTHLEEKSRDGRLVIVGRLVASKRVADAVAALAELRRTLPRATLTIIGTGPEEGALRQLATRLGVPDAVVFAGRVTEAEKALLLQRADVVVACAVREGWGLTVTEGARLGTPAVGYAVSGLRDSIVHDRTGVLTASSPAALAAAAGRLLQDAETYERIRRAAWLDARDLTWDRTAAAFAAIVDAAADGR